MRIGVQLHPQHCTVAEIREAWKRADAAGIDSIWIWDHFFPLYGDPDGRHYEAWTLLSAMACDTSHAKIGLMVGCNTYRNPDLVADMARTVDHLSDGRAYLGIGAGWFAREYTEYGYDFGTPGSRLRDLETGLERIRTRLGKLNPAPVGSLPIIVGGFGPKVLARIIAQHADAWNAFGNPAHWGANNAILDEWCAKVGRDPAEIERTVYPYEPGQDRLWRDYRDAGATHMILGVGHPFDLGPVERLLAEVRSG